MQKTTNYDLDITEGTDIANVPISQAPNIRKIDEVMKTNESNGFSPATEVLSGTVHNLTRSFPAAGMIRWIAAAPYAAGDTFTVDGVAVTARTVRGENLPSGAYIVGQCVQAFVDGKNMTVFADSGNALMLENKLPSDFWQKSETVKAGKIYTGGEWVPTGLLSLWPDNYNVNWIFKEEQHTINGGKSWTIDYGSESGLLERNIHAGFIHASIVASGNKQPDVQMNLTRKWRVSNEDGSTRVAYVQIDGARGLAPFYPQVNGVLIPRDVINIQVVAGDTIDSLQGFQVYICCVLATVPS